MTTTPTRLIPRVCSVTTALALSATLALGACANSGDSAAGSTAGAGVGTGPGQCGSVPGDLPAGASALLTGLTAQATDAYKGLPSALTRSMWASWKPSRPGPHKVAILWNPPANAFATVTLENLTRELKASGDVDITATLSPSSFSDVPGQLQQFNQVLAQKPDLIIILPLAAQPAVQAAEAAGKSGVPVISAWNVIPSSAAVSVGVNNFRQAAVLGAKVVTALGGKGNVLQVRGIPGVAQDAEAAAGFAAVLKNCPDIKVVGSVTGNYASAPAKAATLQFLSANPGKIDGVLQSGTMTSGIISAFQQLGRPMPVIADIGASQGSVAFAKANKSTYKMFGTAGADAAIGRTIGTVALRVLAGDGPTVNQLITEPALITNENLDAVAKPTWTVASGDSAAADDDPFMSAQLLDSFFTAKD